MLMLVKICEYTTMGCNRPHIVFQVIKSKTTSYEVKQKSKGFALQRLARTCTNSQEYTVSVDTFHLADSIQVIQESCVSLFISILILNESHIMTKLINIVLKHTQIVGSNRDPRSLEVV